MISQLWECVTLRKLQFPNIAECCARVFCLEKGICNDRSHRTQTLLFVNSEWCWNAHRDLCIATPVLWLYGALVATQQTHESRLKCWQPKQPHWRKTRWTCTAELLQKLTRKYLIYVFCTWVWRRPMDSSSQNGECFVCSQWWIWTYLNHGWTGTEYTATICDYLLLSLLKVPVPWFLRRSGFEGRCSASNNFGDSTRFTIK